MSPTPTMHTSKKPDKAAPPKRKALWRRKRLWALVLLLILPGTAMVIVTRTNALRGAVLDGISQSIGCEADAQSVRMTWDGRLVITDLRLLAPGVEESAAQVLHAPKVVARVDWGRALSGSPRVTELRVIRPLVRISQHTETGALNLGALKGSSGNAGALEIPGFTILDGRLEFGEHSDTFYSPLAGSTLRVDGRGAKASPDADLFTYEFTELDSSAQPAPDGTRLAGSIDLDAGSVSAELKGVDLAEWSRRTLPSAYQRTWETLALRGRIPGARLHYAPQTGVELEVDVAGVTMRLPVDLGREEGLQLLELTQVTGTVAFAQNTIDADIDGLVEDLPAQITFHADGLRTDAPFRSFVNIQGFRLESNPRLLPYAPPIAVKVLDRFGGPTGEVDVSFSLARGAPLSPGVVSDVNYQGTMTIRDGEAAFEEFPYPIVDIDAEFEITRERFSISSLTGRCVSGGTIEAQQVTITPPGDGAEVVVNLKVRGVPLDDTFREAMPDSRRALYDVLFDTREHDRLREAGLLRTPEDDADDRPLFALGGLADLDIRIFRPLGEDSRYSTEIDVRLAEAGFVPIGFPYPVIARDVALEITDTKAVVRGATLRGLTGMTGSIEGEVLFPRGEDAQPDLTIITERMPIDAVLAQALPSGGIGEAGSPRDALLELGLSGDLTGRAEIARTIDGRIGFEVNAALNEVTSAPDQALRLEGVTGSLRITRDTLEAGSLAGTIGGSPFNGRVDAIFARPLFGIRSELHGRFEATNVELSAPFEDLAARFDEDGARALVLMRSSLAPRGRVDADLSFDLIGDEDFDYTLRLDPRSDLTLLLDDTRWLAASPSGVITVTPGLATFSAFEGQIGVEGAERYPVGLDGSFATGDGAGVLYFTGDGVRLDSATVRTFIDSYVSGAGDVLETLGIVDADFDMRTTLTMAGGASDADWSLTPRSVVLDRGGVRTETTAGGVVEGTNNAVRLRDFTLEAETWRLGADGDRDAMGTGVFDLTFTATEASPSLLSLLPDRASEALRDIGLTLDGSFALEGATLIFEPSRPARLQGAMHYSGASARIGVPIVDADGWGRVDASEETFTLDLYPNTMILSRVDMTEGHFRFVRHAPGADLLIPVIEARVHDGLLIGRGVVRTSREPETYELSAELASVRFSKVLKNLGVAAEDEETNRGRMDAGLSLYGRLGDATARRGRATVRVQGGRVLDLPGVIPLLELSNLQAPANEKVDLGYADLFVAGEKALVDRLTLFSDSLRIAGAGHVRLDDLTVDLAFSTYGARYVPILSPLIEGLREEFASTRVTGTLGAPEFRTEQLRNTRALLDAIAGPPENATVRPGRAESDGPTGDAERP